MQQKPQKTGQKGAVLGQPVRGEAVERFYILHHCIMKMNINTIIYEKEIEIKIKFPIPYAFTGEN